MSNVQLPSYTCTILVPSYSGHYKKLTKMLRYSHADMHPLCLSVYQLIIKSIGLGFLHIVLNADMHYANRELVSEVKYIGEIVKITS